MKTFAELTDGELSGYLDANVEAVREIVAGLGGVDAALANHLVMGPVILAPRRPALRDQGPRLGPLLHRDPRPRAVRPLRARGVRRQPRGSSSGPATSRRACGGPWTSRRRTPRSASCRRGSTPTCSLPSRPPTGPRACGRWPGACATSTSRREGGSWDRDTSRRRGRRRVVRRRRGASGGLRRQADRLQGRRPAARRLAAGPSRAPGRPPAGGRLRRVPRRRPASGAGTGSAAGDLGPLRELARRGRGARGRRRRAAADAGRLPRRDAAPATRRPPRAAAGSVAFRGRLEHDEVAAAVAAAEALVFPSTFPEAFGMVAAEAAATGALPVSADHSGLRRGQPARSPRALPPALGGAALVRARRRRRRGDRGAGRRAGWRCRDAEREEASAALARDGRAALELGGVARGGDRRPPPGDLDGLPGSRPTLDTHATRSPDERRRRPRDQ